MVIRPLAASDFEAIFVAFNEAFSDYVIPFAMTREQLAAMLARRGWAPEASVAAFDDERMVAFTLNAIEGDRAYDTGTGVVPTHRRRGLARELMLQSFELLRGKTYVLEVIDSNVKAAELYRSLGFRETRGLQCWRYEDEAQRLTGSEAQSLMRNAPVSLCASEPLSLWWDILPSWQNSPSSLARATDPYVGLGDDDSYAVLFPSSGDLAQLAVRPEARRRGLGKRLLDAAFEVAGRPLRIVNVDERDRGISRFFDAVGAARTVRQLEMERSL